MARTISVNGNLPVTGKTATLSVLGADDGGEAKLFYSWSIVASPSGGRATFSVNGTNAAKATTMTFTKAGAYGISVRITDAGGMSVTSLGVVSVVQTVTGFSLSTAGGQLINSNSTLAVSAARQAVVARGLDQFGSAMTTAPSLSWSASAIPTGASSPTFAAAGSTTTMAFGMVGSYTVSARMGGATATPLTFKLNVSQTLTSIVVSPNTGNLAKGGTQQFTAQGLDQFRKPMPTQPKMVWSATGGTITSAGLFKAPSTTCNCTVTAASGSVKGTAAIVVGGNTAPTVAQSIVVNGNLPVTGKTATLSVLGADDGGESKLVYNWSIVTAPAGGSASLSLNGANAAKATTMTFTKAGTYGVSVRIVDAAGLSVTATASIVVQSTLTSFSLRTATGQLVSAGSTLNVSGVSTVLTGSGTDQFGAAAAGASGLAWSATAMPMAGATPDFVASGAATTIAFKAAGSYTLSVRAANSTSVPLVFSVYIDQRLTSVAVSPGSASVLLGATQQFTAQTLDQFGRPMWNQQTIAWTATAGTINAAGLFTAPGSGTSCTVTAKSGTLSGTATVSLVSNSGGLQNANLAALVQSLVADGSISRVDMIAILRSVGTDGAVDATELTDLKKILAQASTLKIPGYVQVLAADVVNGNAANALYQGQALGNLAAGSTSAKLNKLIDKWFLGADHPTLCNTSLVYRSVAGSLFARTPSHLDERQGQLGDCYFISALGALADSNPAAVQNMFVDNGDGTFTVRFYTGTYGTIYNYSDGSISAGFKDNLITVDYVTVDRMLPTSTSGMLVYANYGDSYNNSANTLWIALAEKAYAQWNETGKEGRDGLNAYASIQGGWMATVDAQVLGYNATDYLMNASTKQVAINALAAKKAVTIGTLQWSGTQYGLYGSHAYAVIGYTASTDKFTLYNPWGSGQPGQLTWAQIQSSCSQLVVADTSGTKAISGAPSGTQAVQLWAHDWSRTISPWLADSGGSVSRAVRGYNAVSAPVVDAMFARGIF